MQRLAWWLRCLADRIDPAGAPKFMSACSFTFERDRGLVFRSDGRGCPLWYYGDADYERAHDEADVPAPRVDWKALARPQGVRGLRHTAQMREEERGPDGMWR